MSAPASTVRFSLHAFVAKTALLASLAPTILFGHGALSERIERAQTASGENPSNPELHFKLADLFVEHEDWEKALAELDRAETLAPGQFPTDYLRGSALLLAQRPAEALPPLERFVSQHPQNPLGLLQRARARRELGQVALSLQDFREALKMSRSPEPDLILETADAVAAGGEKIEALVILEQGLAQLGAIPSLMLRALDLEIESQHFDAALKRIETFQRTAPRPEPWMAKRAEVLSKAGRIDEARGAWQALIVHLDSLPNLERGSHSMSLLSEKARQALRSLPPISKTEVSTENKNYEEELERADAQIAANPQDAQAFFHRAEFNCLAQRWARSKTDCDAAEALAPGKFPTDRVRGEVLAGEGKFTEAKELLTRSLESRPHDSHGLAARARVEMKLQQGEAALTDYLQSLSSSPEVSPDLYQEVATAMQRLGRIDDAARILAEGLLKHPDAPALVAQDLEFEISRGHLEPALARIDSCARTSPRPELWLARRARLLTRAGRTEEAKATWRDIITRINARPNLQRGVPDLTALSAEALAALKGNSAGPASASTL